MGQTLYVPAYTADRADKPDQGDFEMGLLNWLVGEAVEAPGIALKRATRFEGVFDPAMSDYRCTDFSEYLKKRHKLLTETASRLEEQYEKAEERARIVCENYSERLAERERRLTDAEEVFLARRKVVIAALRDSKNTALADVIANETMIKRGER